MNPRMPPDVINATTGHAPLGEDSGSATRLGDNDARSVSGMVSQEAP